MKIIRSVLLAAMLVAPAWPVAAQGSDRNSAPEARRSDRRPPPGAFEDCRGKASGAAVQHKTPEGVVPAVCMESPDGLVARPLRPRERGKEAKPGPAPGSPSR